MITSPHSSLCHCRSQLRSVPLESVSELGFSPSCQQHLFFLHLETRRVQVAGITRHPREEWIVQMARNAVDAANRPLLPVRFA